MAAAPALPVLDKAVVVDSVDVLNADAESTPMNSLCPFGLRAACEDRLHLHDAPLARADAYSTNEDTPLTVNAANGIRLRHIVIKIIQA